MLSEHALRIIAALDQTRELVDFFRLIEAIEDSDTAVAAKKSIVVSATRGSDDPVDEHDGSESQPWATIAYALTKAVAGDSILIEPGTYTDYLVFAAPVSIFAKVPGTVTITNAGGSAGAAALTFGAGLLSAAYPIVIFGCKIQGYNGNTNITLGVSGLPAGANGTVIRFLLCEFVAGVSGYGVVNTNDATATARITFDRCVFGIGTLTLERNDSASAHTNPLELNGCTGRLSIVAGSVGAWALKVTSCTLTGGALTEAGATAGYLHMVGTDWTVPAMGMTANTTDVNDTYLTRVHAQSSFGWYYNNGNITAGDTVTIGTRTYEFQEAGAVVPGNVKVGMTGSGAGPWAPAVAIPVLVAAIVADTGRVAAAVLAGDGVTALLAGKDVTTALALSAVSALGTAVVSGAAMIAGLDRLPMRVARRTYTVTAAAVTKWALGAAHEVVIGTITDTSGMAILPIVQIDEAHFNGIAGASICHAGASVVARQAAGGGVQGHMVVCLADPLALFAAGDVIVWSAWAR
jgi:hypothetical protein